MLPFPAVRSGECPSPGCGDPLSPELRGHPPLSELRTGPGGLALGAPRTATVAMVLAGARDAAVLSAPRVRPKPGAAARRQREARKGSAAGPARCAGLREEEEEEEGARWRRRRAREEGPGRPGGRREEGEGAGRAGRGGGAANERRAARGGEGWGMR